MSKTQGIRNLEKVIKSAGVDPDQVDLYALYDDTLTYSENKENILSQIHLSNEVQSMRAENVQAVGEVQSGRSEMALDADISKKARKTYKISNSKGVDSWLKNPNRIDIEDIDAFNTSKRAKRKKRR